MFLPAADAERKALLALWRQLDAERQRTLLRFARFLASEGVAETVETPPVAAAPLRMPRPAVETAVAGLKRLKKSYPMIEADERVLAEASQILMGKVMGMPDVEVIDRLEAFFARCYQEWQRTQHGLTEDG